MRFGLILSAIEVLMLILALVLVFHVGAPWWVIPIAMIVPPVLILIGVIGTIAVDSVNNENPFR